MSKIFGAVETGGTKCVCLAASSPTVILAETQIPTGDPEKTTAAIAEFFRAFEQTSQQQIERYGLACFGPIDLNTQSATYGQILATPKAGWKGWDLPGKLKRALGKEITLDTDVNGAALGEYQWGAAQGLRSFLYLTIGTGIGGGGMLDGRLLHGMLHPEMGHILLPHDKTLDPFAGICPFHGDCFEGLASGPAIQARWSVEAVHLPPEHPAWELEARYIAAALHTLICSLSPERIILGGGVMQQGFLFGKIRRKVQESLAGYVSSGRILDEIDEYIVPPALGKRAGVLGALALAMRGA
jgi:fructokinase